jgi:hypothetical protein
MNKQIYKEQRTYVQYSDCHFIVYLNESRALFIDESGEQQSAINGYAYEGDAIDGGTIIEATEATYPAFVSGLIRNRYSPDAVEAINANRVTALINPQHERAGDYITEWEAYQAFRLQCKDDAKYLLDMIDLEG